MIDFCVQELKSKIINIIQLCYVLAARYSIRYRRCPPACPLPPPHRPRTARRFRAVHAPSCAAVLVLHCSVSLFGNKSSLSTFYCIVIICVTITITTGRAKLRSIIQLNSTHPRTDRAELWKDLS